MIPWSTLWYYWRARRLHFRDRQALEAWQQRKLRLFTQQVLSRSPYFSRFCQQPLHTWPTMDKRMMMEEFDAMNTAGLQRDELLACARRSEETRDFTPQVGRFSVGLSSGTSGQRGLFVVSPRERQMWAGTILAKLLPGGLLQGERVALFLRADNRLYRSVNNRWLSLEFFDLFAPFAEQCQRLLHFAPTIIVAPAQVLCALATAKARGELQIEPKKVISVAEVLEPQDRQWLTQQFPEIGEVYQATEGFLGATCAQGTLHLNEEFIYIEPQWLDDQRFVPLITDFTRTTQPIVRYRLDDILLRRAEPCACGNPALTIAAIEGRCDDRLLLPGRQGGTVQLFADLCNRLLANHLPLRSDYLLQQNKRCLTLHADCDEETLEHCRQALCAHFYLQGVDVNQLEWHLIPSLPAVDFTRKRRRIVRLAET